MYVKQFLLCIICVAAAVLLAGSGCSKKEAQVKETEPEVVSIEGEEQIQKEIEGEREGIPEGEEESLKEETISALEEQVEEQSFETVYFDFDSSSLSTEMREVLKRDAELLIKSPDIKVLLEGHCDERGTAEYNLALGERRSFSVKGYLESLGIDSVRLETISYGEERPADPGSGEEAWAKNRRVQFKILSR